MTEYRLGIGLARIIPFYNRQKDEPIISNKIIYIFGIIAVIKIAVLFML